MMVVALRNGLGVDALGVLGVSGTVRLRASGQGCSSLVFKLSPEDGTDCFPGVVGICCVMKLNALPMLAGSARKVCLGAR